MAIIYTYGFDDNVQDRDAWVGTNSGNRKTKQFSALSVANYMNRYGRISIGGQMSYKLVASSPGLGEMSIIGGGDGTNFADIEFLNISTHDLSGAQVVEFLDYLTSTGILISRQNEPSVFGHYTVVAYTATIDPNVYRLELGILGSNGVVNTNMYYDLSPLNLAGGSGSGVNTIDTSEGSFITLTPTTPTAGNVLITADLSATGTPDATTFLRGDNTWAAAGEVDGNGTTNYVSKWADPSTLTDSVIYDDGAYVGIGTTSPATKLHIADVSTPTIRIEDTTNNRHLQLFHDNNSSYIRSSISSQIRFQTNGANDRMLIDTSGNVGIGTTSPATLLNLSGNNPDLRFDDTSALTRADLNSEIGFYDSTGANGSYIGHRGSVDLVLRSSAGAMRLGTFADSFLMNLVGGNVGIGTTSPSQKLEVAGVIPKIYINSANNTGGSIIFDDNLSTGTEIQGTQGNVIFKKSGSENMRLTSDGKLGIGTTSPATKLHVSGGGGVFTPVLFTLGSNDDGTGTNAAEIRLLDNGTTKWQVGKTSLNDFWVYDNTAGRSVITARDNGNLLLMQTSGNVGIGTSGPTQELHVDGNARVTGAFYDSNNSAGAVGQVLTSTSTSTEWTDPGSMTQVPVPVTAFAGGSLALAATVNFVYLSWLGGSGTYTLNLPSAVTYPYKVIRFVTDSGTNANNKIHIQGSLGQTVDGGTFYALDKAYNGVQVWSDGSEWIVIQAKAT